MFLPQVVGFVEFLSNEDHTLEEILNHTVVTVLQPLGATSAFISQLNSEHMIENVSRVGITDELNDKYPALNSLNEKLPVTSVTTAEQVPHSPAT